MAKSTDKFKSIVGTMVAAQEPVNMDPTAPAKSKITTFELDADLRPLLDRMVFWMGKGGSMRVVINRALRELAERDENAHRKTPDEK